MKKFFENLLDLIYKKKCYFCSKTNESIKMCSICYNEMDFAQFYPTQILLSCDVYCAGVYGKNLQKLIRGLKYHNQKDLAYFQAKFMYDYWKNTKICEKTFQLIPVPLHKNRKKKRHYNHMELVAEEFSKLTGYPCSFDVIKRVKNTAPQYKLNRQQRLKNLDSAFEIAPSKLKDCDILILDDICTTGSTFESIIKKFKEENITNITCFATASAN